MKPHRAVPAQLAAAALADLDRARDAVARIAEDAKGQFKVPFKAPSNPPASLAEWRAAHRSGTPSRLDTDAELRAFVLARIDTQTYDQIVQAVASAFPPERRVSRSTLSRWFRRQRGAPAGASIG